MHQLAGKRPGMTQGPYPLVRQRVPGEKPTALDNPQFRSRAIALASQGMSRRGVAARMGVPHPTLFGWLERGRAEPDKEPYGSFAVDFLMAERGLEDAASSAVAMRVQQIVEQMRAVLEWTALKDKPKHEVVNPVTGEVTIVEAKGPKGPAPAEFDWLLRVQASRWPDDHGTSATLRQPEPDPSGEAWLERTGMNHSQLVHMLKAPPEPVAKALAEAADQVYELLLSTGWQPKGSYT